MEARCLRSIHAVYPLLGPMTTPSAPGLANTLAHPHSESVPRAVVPPARPRLESVDVLRGLVMVIMMIDHTRDFVNAQNFQFDATDVTTNDGAPLLHPLDHAFLRADLRVPRRHEHLPAEGARKIGLSSFLLKRGLWLVVLELTLLKLVIWFTFAGTFTFLLQVIWVIGIGMICMAGLVRLPTWVSAALGARMIALHNLTDGVRVHAVDGSSRRRPERRGQALDSSPSGRAAADRRERWADRLVLYSLIPWVGVMAAGYAFGRVYDMEAGEGARCSSR